MDVSETVSLIYPHCLQVPHSHSQENQTTLKYLQMTQFWSRSGLQEDNRLQYLRDYLLTYKYHMSYLLLWACDRWDFQGPRSVKIHKIWQDTRVSYFQHVFLISSHTCPFKNTSNTTGIIVFMSLWISDGAFRAKSTVFRGISKHNLDIIHINVNIRK